MTRDQVFSLIQAHLADELDLDPARIDDSTRFKEDLEADSLDLYTLVQEYVELHPLAPTPWARTKSTACPTVRIRAASSSEIRTP